MQETDTTSNTPNPSGRSRQEWLDELDAIINDTTTADLETLRARLQAQIGKTRAAFDALAGSSGDLAHEAVACAETYVQQRPWQALGVAAGIGVLLGLALNRH
ncbi:ElaB/YgaM/YqjD family protein [Bordetella sp. 2513F-2]